MNESKSLTLDDLTNLFDDVEPAEHDDSPENTGIPQLAPPPPGKYGTRLLSIDVDRDQNGEVRNKRRFICDFQVVSAPTDGAFMIDRKIRFIPVMGDSRKRKDKAGREVSYVELFDLCKGFDPTFSANGSIDTALRFLLERIADNSVITWQLDWKAWDNKHFETSNGAMLEDGTPEKRELMKTCSFKGARHFQKDGSMINTVSGSYLRAKPFLKFVYRPTPAASE